MELILNINITFLTKIYLILENTNFYNANINIFLF